MAELTGIPTEGFFRSTASVHHFELSDLSRDEGALRDRLQASISGADRGTSRARKKLDKALHDLGTRGDRNPGRLKVAEKAVEDARAAVDQGEMALAQLERDRDALSSAHDRRTDAETALAERRSMLEKARQAERVTAERDAAAERYERYRQAVDVAAEVAVLEGSHPTPHPLPVLKTGVERLRTLDGRIRELRAALSGEIEVTFDLAPEPTWRPLSRVSLALVAIGILLAGGPVVLEFLGIAELGIAVQAVGAIIAVVGLVLAAVALWLRRSVNQQAQLRDVEIDRRLRGRSDMEAELVDCELQASAQLGSLGLADLAEAEDLLAREEAHVAAIDVKHAQLEGLVGKEPPATLPSTSATPPRSRSRRRRARSRRSGRSPRNRGRANGSRSRSATRRAPSSGRATTRPTPAPGSRPTASTPSRSPATPSAWPPGASSWPPRNAASASSTSRSRASTAPSRPR